MGYDPVVTADTGDPAGQIDHVLDHIGEYQELVDRNFGRLLEVGTWDMRAREMLAALAVRGIASAAR